MNEADIQIEGRTLTEAQSATVRAALNQFIGYVIDNRKALGPIADSYRERANEVLSLIHREEP